MFTEKSSPQKITGPTIIMCSGKYFDYEDPYSSEFTISDIAHALSNVCRFAGHTPYHYSVAQHSVYVSQLVADEFKLAALLHDAAEAFIGDMVRPLKQIMPEFKEMEKKIEAAIFVRFGLKLTNIFQIGQPNVVSAYIHPSIKAADNAMLRAEQIQLMANGDHWSDLHKVEAAPVIIEKWSPEKAKIEFLSEFYGLSGKDETSGPQYA